MSKEEEKNEEGEEEKNEEGERNDNFDAFIKNSPDPEANFPNFCEGIRNSYEKIGKSPELSPISYSSQNKVADLQKYKLRIISVSKWSTSKIKKIITEAKKDGIKNIVIYIENSKTFKIYDLRVIGGLSQKCCESFVLGDLSKYYRALRRLFSLSFADEFNFYNNSKKYRGIDGFRFIVLARSKLVIHNKKRKIYPDPYSICNTTVTGHEEYDLTEDKKLLDFLTRPHIQLVSDHIVPQEYAYHHGGENWPISKMIEFEYSLDNEVIIEAATNSGKSNSGPSKWLPILKKSEGHKKYSNYSPKNYELILSSFKSQQNLIRETIEDYCFTWDKVIKRFGIQLEKEDQKIIQFVINSAINRGRNPHPINPHYRSPRLVWPR